MKVIAPRFFSAFHCIADRCSDSCCIGWEIDVDPESEAFYRAQSGEIGNRLRAALEAGADNVYFRLGTGERCPFLNGQNLCDLYIALGPEHLCAICREHPRFYSWWGSFVEAGLGLCCEEACRLLLADERPLTFVESKNDAPDEACELSEDELSFLLEARGKLFSVLQDRSLPIEARLRRCLTLSQQIQDEWDGFPPLDDAQEAHLPDVDAVLALAAELEPIDEGWTQLLHRAERCGKPVVLPDYVIEHAAVYLLYRWFLLFARDGDLMGGMLLTVRFCVLLRILLERGAVASPAEGLRLLSKEIEYSAENTDRFASAE